MSRVCEKTGLSTAEVIRRHSENEGLDLLSFPKTTTRAAILIYRLTR